MISFPEEMYSEFDAGYAAAVYDGVKPWDVAIGWTFPYWCGVKLGCVDSQHKTFINSNAVRVWIGESTWEERLSNRV